MISIVIICYRYQYVQSTVCPNFK